MNFFGLLWVLSAVSSFVSPLGTPRVLDYFSKAIPSPLFALFNQASNASVSGNSSNKVASAVSDSPSRIVSRTIASRVTQQSIGFLSPLKLTFPTSTLAPSLAPAPISQLATLPLYQTSRIHLVSQFSLKGDIPSPILQLVDSFTRWSGEIRDVFRLSTPLVSVEQAQNFCSPNHIASHRLNRWQAQGKQPQQVGFGDCTALWKNDFSRPKPVETVFQVRMQEQVILEVPEKSRAEAIARRLSHLLHDPDFNPYEVLPTWIDGMPAARVGNQILFWLDAEAATLLDRNAELSVIQWVNNLRSALDVPPLSLVEAQSQMYGLVSTKERISGVASWYGPYFHGRITATGEIFNQHELTAAHPSLPFGTYLRVSNLLTGKEVIVRINDRGPYFENRSLDLSLEAARCLDSEMTGVVPYEAVVMQSAELMQIAEGSNVVLPLNAPQSLWARQP